jgi:hypothetical protein
MSKASQYIVDEILAERARQVIQEGFTADHDDAHDDNELARAAATYAVFAGEPRRFTMLAEAMRRFIPTLWPWDAQWWRPSAEPRRNLIKAAALIVAEIERLDRKTARPATTETSA